MNLRRTAHKLRCRFLRLLAGLGQTGPELLLLGDSLTAACYPVFLARLLRRAGLNLRLRIIARCGVTSAELASMVEHQRRGKPSPKHGVAGAVILVGGNDLKRTPLSDFDEFNVNIQRITAFVRQRWPNTFVILCTLPIPGSHPALPKDAATLVTDLLNPRIRKVATSIGGAVCELENLFVCAEELRPDGIHPSFPGDRLLAEEVFRAIARCTKNDPEERTS